MRAEFKTEKVWRGRTSGIFNALLLWFCTYGAERPKSPRISLVFVRRGSELRIMKPLRIFHNARPQTSRCRTALGRPATTRVWPPIPVEVSTSFGIKQSFSCLNYYQRTFKTRKNENKINKLYNNAFTC